MERTVEGEWLDSLPSGNNDAIASRSDLLWLNRAMGHIRRMTAELREMHAQVGIQKVVELGAGDGQFMLQVCQRLAPICAGWEVMLVDRRESLSETAAEAFGSLGVKLNVITADVFDWIGNQPIAPQVGEVWLANLFLHHFEGDQIVRIFRGAVERVNRLIALEPRRCALSYRAACLTWAVGCNRVTQHDAPLSVRAGFRNRELTKLWPENNWKVEEMPAGLFSHIFKAERMLT